MGEGQFTGIRYLRPKSERLNKKKELRSWCVLFFAHPGEMIGVCGSDLTECIGCSSKGIDLLVRVSYKHLGSLLTSQNINNGCKGVVYTSTSVLTSIYIESGQCCLFSILAHVYMSNTYLGGFYVI